MRSWVRNDDSIWRRGVHAKFGLLWRLGERTASASCQRCSVYRKAADRSPTPAFRSRIMETWRRPVRQIVKSTCRGRQLEYFTIGYNSLESVTSVVAGLIACSVSLIGFGLDGLDSLIEVTSGAALLWRLRHDLNISRREQVERTALRTVGA